MKMKKSIHRLLIYLFLIVLSSMLNVQAQTIRILAIGNSFSEDAVEQYLYELGDTEGINFIIGNMYIGGCTLEKHWNNADNNIASYSYRKVVNGVKTSQANTTLEYAIKDEPWDYISFQQASPNSGQYATYLPYLTELLAYVKGKTTNPKVAYILHQTWAYAQTSTHTGFANYGNSQQTMYDAIIDATHRIKENVQDISIIIPSGSAIQNGRTSGVGDNFCRDGYHLDYKIGRYTAACTWFEKITGISAIGNVATPTGLDDFRIRVAQTAAHFAVLNPEEVTLMTDFIESTDNNTILHYPINISFGSAVSSSSWNSLTNAQNSIISGLKDLEGNDTGIMIEVDDAFGGINTNGPTSTSTVLNMPSEVSSSSFYGNALPFNNKTETTGGFLLSRLNKEYIYSFTMFSSRIASDNRETYFTVDGANEKTVTVNSSGNINVVDIREIQPTSQGTISLRFGAGNNNNQANKFFYVNALQIKGTKLEQNSIDEDVQLSLKFHPSLVTDVAYIQSSSFVQDAVVYNLQGYRILSLGRIEPGNNVFDLSSLQKGIYILKVQKTNVLFLKS